LSLSSFISANTYALNDQVVCYVMTSFCFVTEGSEKTTQLYVIAWNRAGQKKLPNIFTRPTNIESHSHVIRWQRKTMIYFISQTYSNAAFPSHRIEFPTIEVKNTWTYRLPFAFVQYFNRAGVISATDI